MAIRTHSVLREGTIAGLTGAIVAIIWYFIVDSIAGMPFRTPNLLGQVLAHGDRTPNPDVIDGGAILGYTLLHFASFIVIGMVLTALVHLVLRERSLRMGLWLGVVLGFTWLVLHAYLLSPATGYRVPWWSTVIAAALGSIAMVWWIWRLHPGLRESLREEPLGDVNESPPAPPPRAGGEPQHRR
ncbi:MAG TPA: hypothetical protein VFW66_06695 [Gemmatimonadales bacterium]|nr:hypothetical protein [Gemmatimonadales bacterium]